MEHGRSIRPVDPDLYQREPVPHQRSGLWWSDTDARYADLVVIGQAEPDASATTTPEDLAETVAISGERPVLIVPHIGVVKPPEGK